MTQFENLTYVASASDYTNNTVAAGFSRDTGHRYSDLCLFKDEDGDYFLMDHVICDNKKYEWWEGIIKLDEDKTLLAMLDPALVLLDEDKWYQKYYERKEDYVEKLINALKTLL